MENLVLENDMLNYIRMWLAIYLLFYLSCHPEPEIKPNNNTVLFHTNRSQNGDNDLILVVNSYGSRFFICSA
jgi:hypothetical protein